MGNVQTLVSKCLFQRNIKTPIEDSKQANMVPTKEIQGQNCNKIYWSQLALGNITKKKSKGNKISKAGNITQLEDLLKERKKTHEQRNDT